jgi:Fe-S-cluster-containing dehydrogenase component
MEKRIFVVANELCSGCRNCEMWCSLGEGQKNEFRPTDSTLKILKDAEGVLNIPTVDCDGQRCLHNEKGEPLCVEMCPTGTLIYSDRQDLYKKRLELEEKRSVQPLFRLIAPWKYPYPWKEWPGEEF